MPPRRGSVAALAVHAVEIAAREQTPYALELLASMLDDSGDRAPASRAIGVLRSLLENDDPRIRLMAARALATVQQRAAVAIAQMARLMDRPGQGGPLQAGGVTVVINRQGKSVKILANGQQLDVSEDETAAGESVGSRLSVGAVEAEWSPA